MHIIQQHIILNLFKVTRRLPYYEDFKKCRTAAHKFESQAFVLWVWLTESSQFQCSPYKTHKMASKATAPPYYFFSSLLAHFTVPPYTSAFPLACRLHCIFKLMSKAHNMSLYYLIIHCISQWVSPSAQTVAQLSKLTCSRVLGAGSGSCWRIYNVNYYMLIEILIHYNRALQEHMPLLNDYKNHTNDVTTPTTDHCRHGANVPGQTKTSSKVESGRSC